MGCELNPKIGMILGPDLSLLNVLKVSVLLSVLRIYPGSDFIPSWISGSKNNKIEDVYLRVLC
jgi:hypothetical protein